MTNSILKSKKLLVALLLSVLLLANLGISALISTGTAFARKPDDVFGWQNIKNGDLIDMGSDGNRTYRWRVIDKSSRGTKIGSDGQSVQTDNMGILLRLEQTIAKQSFDSVDFLADREYKRNDLVSIVEGGSSVQENNRRSIAGTNLWSESEIRDYLNSRVKDGAVADGFMNAFSDAEYGAILQDMPQQQLLWWGDGPRTNSESSKSVVVFNNQNQGTDIPGLGDVDRGAYVGEWESYSSDEQSPHESVDDVAGQNVHWLKSNKIGDDAINNARSALRYTIKDAVFLPSIEQIVDMKNNASLPKDYHIAKSIVDDKPISSWTRTPDASFTNGGSRILTVETDDTFKAEDNSATSARGFTPMMYLSTNTIFKNRTTIQEDGENRSVFDTVDTVNGTYSRADLVVGDYISDLGGQEWRVVGFDDNGILLRTVYSIANLPFDEPRYLDSGDLSRPAWNSIIKADTNVDLSGTRHNNGSNFYLESSVRDYLINEFFANRFSQDEKDSIVTVQQSEHFWWGDLDKERAEGDGQRGKLPKLTAETDMLSQGLGIANGHVTMVNRPTNSLTEEDINVPYDWDIYKTVDLTGGTDGTQKDSVVRLGQIENLKQLRSYNFADPIFLPSASQVYNISKLPLKAVGTFHPFESVERDTFEIVYQKDSDLSKAPGYAWLRTPNMWNGLRNTRGNNNDKYGVTTGTAGLVIGGGPRFIYYSSRLSATSVDGESLVAPMVYLSNDTGFEYVGNKNWNLGESADTVLSDFGGKRPTSIDNSNEGLKEFNLSHEGIDISTDEGLLQLEDSLQNLVVGQEIAPIKLSEGLHHIKENEVHGLILQNITDTKQQIVGMPTKEGTPQLLISRDKGTSGDVPAVQEQTIDTFIQTAKTQSSTIGQLITGEIENTDTLINKVDSSVVKVTAMYESQTVNVEGSWKWSGDLQTNFGVDENGEPNVAGNEYKREAEFTAKEADKFSKTTAEITILFTDDIIELHEEQDKDKPLLDLKVVLEYKEGQVLGEVENEMKSQLQAIIKSDNVQIKLYTNSQTLVGPVGHKYFKFEFLQISTGAKQFIDVDTEVNPSQAEFPSGFGFLYATYGQTLGDLTEQLDAMFEGSMRFVEEDLSTEVGDATIDSTLADSEVGDSEMDDRQTRALDVYYEPQDENQTAVQGQVQVVIGLAERSTGQKESAKTTIEEYLAQNPVLAGISLTNDMLPQGFEWVTKEGGNGTLERTVRQLGWQGQQPGEGESQPHTNYVVHEFKVSFKVVDPKPEKPPIVLIVLGIVGGLAVLGLLAFLLLKKKQSKGNKF
ncbi:MAG: hypothetical protein LBU60_05835 [Clostridiales bacterium]|jgi:hypothetical protein|nr:hypothetical protein [Clostridiales bacterium]